MLFSDTDQRQCSRSVGFLNLPTRRSFKLAKRTAIVCGQTAVSQAVLCRWASVLHRVLVTLLTTAKWRTAQQDHHKSLIAWKIGFQIPLKDSSAHWFANGLLDTGVGFGTFKNWVSSELEYVLSIYLHCKLKFKERCDGRINFLADSAMSESHDKCVLLDRQSLNCQDE